MVIPKLILQKTWGGDYIALEKRIEFDNSQQIKLGQSYELFSGTRLSTSNEGKNFVVGHPDNDEIYTDISQVNDDEINLANMTEESPEMTLGKNVLKTGNKMPLLLKLTQAKGNSFQLHIKPNIEDQRWLPKSETWYFFEKGKVTCGIAKGISIKDYQEACTLIDEKMRSMSQQIGSNQLSVTEAREKAMELIYSVNPWQFVQIKNANMGEIFDMSRGGIHHSWEEDTANSRGNILYEVQQDRMDPVSTIRCFDQGKIDDNGKIREINIQDYFKYLDTSAELNEGNFSGKNTGGNNAFTTADYAMDIIELENKIVDATANSFCHYYVKSGKIKVETDEGWVIVDKGWSCLVPAAAATNVNLESLDKRSTILKTYVPN